MAKTLVGRVTLSACALLLLLAIGGLNPPSAQAQDLNTLYKQFEQAYKAGRYAKAERLAKQAFDICEQRFGQNSSNCVYTLNNLANVYESQGRYADAIPLLERALAINEKALGREHPEVATSLNLLARLYGGMGRFTEALGFSQRASVWRMPVKLDLVGLPPPLFLSRSRVDRPVLLDCGSTLLHVRRADIELSAGRLYRERDQDSSKPE